MPQARRCGAGRAQSCWSERAVWDADLAEAVIFHLLFDKAKPELGPVSILVTSAAHCPGADSLLDLSPSWIDDTYAVDVRATLLLITEFARRHKKHQLSWGQMLNVGTGPAQEFIGQLACGTGKAAIEAATRAIAHEIGLMGITVNAVAPGDM